MESFPQTVTSDVHPVGLRGPCCAGVLLSNVGRDIRGTAVEVLWAAPSQMVGLLYAACISPWGHEHYGALAEWHVVQVSGIMPLVPIVVNSLLVFMVFQCNRASLLATCAGYAPATTPAFYVPHVRTRVKGKSRLPMGKRGQTPKARTLICPERV
eukprot:1159242-Pelagomonas_calceolata.AAC.7